MLKRFISLFFIVFCSLGLMLTDAEAKRFGGGKSFGMQRSATSFSSRPASSFANNAVNQQRPGMSRWLAPLAGLAMGGLLASLFMGNGIGSGILSWLMIGGVVLLIISLIRKRSAATTHGFRQTHSNNIFEHQAQQSYHSNAEPQRTAWQPGFASSNSAPVGFDKDEFLRDAKVQFIRLQAAYDQKNLQDLREFTAPSVFGEIQLQLQERGNAANHTEVVSLNADFLSAENEASSTVASVRFSGLIKEDSEQAQSFAEVWHFRKEQGSRQWIVAGLQQDN